MAVVRVTHGIGELAADMKAIPPQLYREGRKVVQKSAREGGLQARAIARHTAGEHGKHYPMSITWDRSARSYAGFGGGAIEAEYGPDPAKPQGGMSFEYGSRNQPPHLDLAKSLDRIAPWFHIAVDEMIDGLFWPGGE